MNSSVTSRFWREYVELPPEIRRKARKAFQLWKRNPRHPSRRCALSAKATIGRCESVKGGGRSLAWRKTRPTGSPSCPTTITSDFLRGSNSGFRIANFRKTAGMGTRHGTLDTDVTQPRRRGAAGLSKPESYSIGELESERFSDRNHLAN